MEILRIVSEELFFKYYCLLNHLEKFKVKKKVIEDFDFWKAIFLNEKFVKMCI